MPGRGLLRNTDTMLSRGGSVQRPSFPTAQGHLHRETSVIAAGISLLLKSRNPSATPSSPSLHAGKILPSLTAATQKHLQSKYVPPLSPHSLPTVILSGPHIWSCRPWTFEGAYEAGSMKYRTNLGPWPKLSKLCLKLLTPCHTPSSPHEADVAHLSPTRVLLLLAS
jgi:hypothetical protein